MRLLTKIFFVNSAGIRYSEIMLDGNVHLIGTQGVGKSTVLRAILFFYNGDTQKLGIPREKKIFAEYYFPYANSYIVYEVRREHGSFSILVMRSGSGVQFRFIDAAFDPDWLIQNRQALERWGNIRQELDRRGIDSSGRIDRLQEYRDVIYGNAGVNPSYRKYALLESKQYQNIPRTISNVFLNTKLEASFIKETIIQSLSEEELKIDLLSYRHHLRDFEREYGDIQIFKKKKTQEQAEKIIAAFNHCNRARADLMRNAAMLGASAKMAESEQKRLGEKLEKAREEKNTLEQKHRAKEKRQQDKVNLIMRDVKVLENQIRLANKKEREYKESGIEEVRQRSARKREWENRLERLNSERQTLTGKYAGIEQQYEVRLQQMENNLRSLENERKTEENALKADFQERKQSLLEKQAEEIETFTGDYDNHVAVLEQRAGEQREAETTLRESRSRAETRHWHGDALEALNEALQKAESTAKESVTAQVVTQGAIVQLKKDWEREEEKLAADNDAKKAKLDARLVETDRLLDAVNDKLSKHSDALYGYLEQHYPDWQESIGKVAREELLFDTDLQPELKKDAAKLLYGLQLNLQNLDSAAMSLEQYGLEKKRLEEEGKRLRKEIEQLHVHLQENLNKLKKRFKPKIREYKEENQKRAYEQSRQEELGKKKALEREELLQKAKEDKRMELDRIKGQMEILQGEMREVEQDKRRLKEDFNARKQLVQKEYAKRLRLKEEKIRDSLSALAAKFDLLKKEVQSKIEAIQKEKRAEMHGAGADTEQLAALDEKINFAEAELTYIAEKQELLFGYRKDKAELFDKVDDMKKQRAQKEEKHALSERSLEVLKALHKAERDTAEEAIIGFDNKRKKISEGYSELENFGQTDLYREIAPWLHDDPSEAVHAYQVRELIGQIRDTSISLNSFRQALQDAANRLLGAFSEANLFSFQTKLSVLADYMSFAADLREFVDENKIEAYEQRVNARFANILSLVGKETGDLISREGEIQKVITKINADFRTRNFVGVIQSMELKVEDSANRVVRTLKRIRDYEQERGFELGEQNLFNAANAEETNQRAVEFLRQLSRDITEVKQDLIRLSDAFELRFRVVENENDSGWVEKLSNVGSEGTDVLVKAMINILLLNVFKESASRKFKEFRLHCMMDEIGRLHPTNVRGILKFANERNILLINGSPVEQDAMAYRHIYELRKDKESKTRIKRLITVNIPEQVGNA